MTSQGGLSFNPEFSNASCVVFDKLCPLRLVSLSIKYTEEYGSCRDVVKVKCTVCPAQQKIDKLHFLSLFGEIEGLLHIYLFFTFHKWNVKKGSPNSKDKSNSSLIHQ